MRTKKYKYKMQEILVRKDQKIVINVNIKYNLNYKFRIQNFKQIEKMKLNIYNHNLNYKINMRYKIESSE